MIVPRPLLPSLPLPFRRGAGMLLLMLTFWLAGMAAFFHVVASVFD
ncbi:hypothetical protein M0638_00130 [Roseomonas sp. NAR14]|uniref:Uncharacterized protein n=1 Tax=Roseomonas acroporae TaxID=2937791 RepID=A0A9X2BS67_9PROT|nr:hypothetical protein [Roseomonas acroporae]MCK8782787.1 hypothetical protein [Roseomonas acroporae]